MATPYNHKAIEQKWRKHWQEHPVNAVPAARLLWWPECPLTTVTAAVSRQVRAHTPGVSLGTAAHPGRLRGRSWPAAHRGPGDLGSQSLIPALGGQAIDEALRRRAVDLTTLQRALELTPSPSEPVAARVDRRLARRTLVGGRAPRPPPAARRRHHRLGHQPPHRGRRSSAMSSTSRSRRSGSSSRSTGWRYHKGRTEFVTDRWRYSRLAAADWAVLPLAATAIEDDPEEFVGLVAEALRTRSAVARAGRV